LKTARKLITFSLAAFILMYQPRMALLLLLKENGVSNVKGTVLLLVSRDKTDRETRTLAP
jgi:hypothetical protein